MTFLPGVLLAGSGVGNTCRNDPAGECGTLGDAAWLEYTMKTALVLYATREGQTRKIARFIADQLRSSGSEVRLMDARDTGATGSLDLAAFDLLVFGASMHAGGLEREIVEFINNNGERIRRKERSFFLVLLSAATKDSALREEWLGDAQRKMAEQIRVDFGDIEMIAGALAYSKYPLPLKWMMRRIAKKAGESTNTSRDYEYTDWTQVEQYARRLAGVQ